MPFSLDGFLLVFGRVSGLFLSAPVYSSRQIPVQLRVLFALLLAAVMASTGVPRYEINISNTGLFLLALLQEMLTGYALGLVAYMVFAGIQLAGQLMDMQMGFGIVNVVDPQSGIQVPLIGNFNYLLALLVFLGINGHHLLLLALHQSYQFVPVLGVSFVPGFTRFVVELGAYMFVVGLKIAAPVVAALFVADVALGFMARTVPQMNVFLVGIPLKILGGILMLLVFLPVYIWFLQVLFARFFGYLDQAVSVLAG
ncbi:MAG: flagellar type III secretion system protein FliR [Syntrophomonadaceae bacterium]|nr:flagellar type III secretion system protein FliR [Syntrophomonadaceae bacterium]